MASGAELTPGEAVALLTLGTGDDYELVGRLSGGETGAHKVNGPRGRVLVVKWDSAPRSQTLRREGVVLSERLRNEAGWPVPQQWTHRIDNCLFVVQEFMPGGTIDVLGHRVIDRILELHAERVGLSPTHVPSHWPSALIRTLTVGGERYCLHDSLRSYDKRTALLLSRIEAFGHTIHRDELAGHGIVHWDLHPGNLLVDAGNLSAIVDTDFTTVGDPDFDLVTLALASLMVPCEPGVRTRLFATIDDLGHRRKQAYLSHLFIRYLDWPIRRGRTGETEFWLERADEMLTL
jgi:thiamine kinase-like enzyme